MRLLTQCLLGIGLPLMAALSANACDVVALDGQNLHQVVAQNAGKRICMNAGSYQLGAQTLDLPQGSVLEGLPSDRASVRLLSSAEKAIVTKSNTMLKNFTLVGSGLPTNSTFGVLSYHDDSVIIWSLMVQKFLISVGVNGSSNVNIWDTFMQENGVANNGLADPNLWINSASNVTILYGEARGRGNGPSGDGEMAAYNSRNVVIDGTHVVDSGASAIYFVNCDDCSISNTTIHRPNEWGLDVVSGSDNFRAHNNTVAWANYGGAVFDEAGSVGGQFTNNSFNRNRRMGVGSCNGINVIGAISGVMQSGNTSTPSGTICKYQ